MACRVSSAGLGMAAAELRVRELWPLILGNASGTALGLLGSAPEKLLEQIQATQFTAGLLRRGHRL